MQGGVRVLILFVLTLTYVLMSPYYAGAEANYRWGVYVYMDANNFLGKKGIDKKTIQELKKGSKENNGVVIFANDVKPNNSKCFKIANGKIKNISKCGKTINSFLKRGLSLSKTKKSMLVLWGTADTDFFGLKGKTAKSWGKVGKEIASAERFTKKKLDLVLIDACNSYSLLSLAGLDGKAKYLIASSFSVPMSGFPYDNVIKDLGENVLKSAESIVDSYVEKYRNSSVTVNATVANIGEKNKELIISLIKDVCNHTVKAKVKENKPVAILYLSYGYWFPNGVQSCYYKKKIHEISHISIYGRNNKDHINTNTQIFPILKVTESKKANDEKKFYEETLGKKLGDRLFNTLISGR